MSQTVQHRRRVNGAAGAPATAGSLEGEIAINFPGAAGSAGTPELWAYDGTGFRRLNPPGTAPNVRGVTAVSGAGAVEAAFNADTINVAAGDIVIYTHAGSAYVYTGSTGSPVTGATAGDFTALGAAATYATPAQVRAGTLNNVGISPQGLAAVLPAAVIAAGTSGAQAGHPTNPAAATGVAGDAGRIVTLDATGHVDPALINIAGFTFKSADGTAAPTGADLLPASAPAGTLVAMTTAGALNAGWGVAGNPNVDVGDMLLMDNANQYHLIESAVDLAAYLPLAGGTITPAAGGAAGAAALTFDVTASVATAGPGGHKVAIDAGGGELTNGIIDGGTF